MKKQLLTDIELRAQWSQNRSRTYYVEEGVMLTPAAQDFVREHEITLCYVAGCGDPDPSEGSCAAPMSAPAPLYNGNPSVWNRANAPAKPAPAIPTAPLYNGNPTVWRRGSGSALPTATDYAGNPPVWDRERIRKAAAPWRSGPAAETVPAAPADDCGCGGGMTASPIPQSGGKPRYQIAGTGQALDYKPEEMTHLRGSVLVPKTHPRIAFRGKLDSLIAKFLEVQLLAREKGESQVVTDLEDLVSFTRSILGAEVKDQPLAQAAMLGMDDGEIRDVSHHIKREYGISHPIPHHQMGRLCVALNSLRTQVRETELAAAAAFSENGTFTRTDLIQGLNRLSSAVYIIFCRKLSGWYERRERP